MSTPFDRAAQRPATRTARERYYFLLFARILSGVGEASVASISVPYLDDRAPPEKKGLYLAVYFSASTHARA